jgi:nucleoside-diphosphate-sugar epimerase
MRALVTGATGFAGGHLARQMQKEGHAVRVLARASQKAHARASEGFEIATGDLADAAALDRAVAGCEAVFHVAALYRVDGVADRMFQEVNVEGTRRLLEAALRHGVRRFIHTSSVGVHGAIAHPPADETWPFAPRDAYQRSKCDGERVAASFRSRGLDVVIVRPVGIFGPGDTRFLKLFRAIARGRFVMLGSGRSLYQLTYVEDLVRGMLLCAKKPEASGEDFIISGPPAVTINELVQRVAQTVGAAAPRLRLPLWPFQLAAPVCQRVCRAIGVEPPLYPRRLEFFSDSRSFSFQKARTRLGYEPRVLLDEGLRCTAEWYRKKGLL